jgi:hypothetical protein
VQRQPRFQCCAIHTGAITLDRIMYRRSSDFSRTFCQGLTERANQAT